MRVLLHVLRIKNGFQLRLMSLDHEMLASGRQLGAPCRLLASGPCPLSVAAATVAAAAAVADAAAAPANAVPNAAATAAANAAVDAVVHAAANSCAQQCLFVSSFALLCRWWCQTRSVGP